MTYIKKNFGTENCLICKNIFNKTSYQQIYCSILCRDNFHKQEQIEDTKKNGPLNKKIKCIICSKNFIRYYSKNNTCSEKCKNITKTQTKQNSNNNSKLTPKYIKARKNYVNDCIICNISFKARLPEQKCCSKECRKLHTNQFHNKYNKDKKEIDINFKIATNLRSRLGKALKRNQKTGSAINDLGCSIDRLKILLQLRFIRNPRNQKQIMTWENYGEWHIDHIIAISKFNLVDRKQLLKACNYTNLQPMWAKDNISKGDK